MPSLATRIFLFLSSYFPLLMITGGAVLPVMYMVGFGIPLSLAFLAWSECWSISILPRKSRQRKSLSPHTSDGIAIRCRILSRTCSHL